MISKNAILGFLTSKYGFRYGSNLIEKLYDSGAMDTILTLGSIIGCCAFGALAANTMWVNVSGLVIAGVSIQTALFDALLPGLLSLVTLLVLYSLFSKDKIKPISTVVVLFAVGFILGVVGIF